MSRERALRIVLVVVGLIFCGLVYPLTMFVRQEPALAMMLSVYVTLGIFLLLAARNPSANRSLIALLLSRHGRALPTPRLWRYRHSAISSHAENCWAWRRWFMAQLAQVVNDHLGEPVLDRKKPELVKVESTRAKNEGTGTGGMFP
jgi:hypothetical protein